jgi:hypothetical protein
MGTQIDDGKFFLLGFLGTRNHQNITISPVIHKKIKQIAMKNLDDFYNTSGYQTVDNCPFLAYLIRFVPIKEAQAETEDVENAGPVMMMPAYLELMIKKNSFNKNKLMLMMAYATFDDLIFRMIEVWNTLDEEIKQLFCYHRPILNIYAKSYTDPEFVNAVLKLFRRSEDVVHAFREYGKAGDISTATVQLTAHWFFVDDFEEEIRTHGHHWMFRTALTTLS